MSEFKRYTRRAYAELRPYIVGEDVSSVSISQFDKKHGSPQAGDYIARNPQNHSDMWLVSAAYFAANHFEVVQAVIEGKAASLAGVDPNIVYPGKAGNDTFPEE